MLSPLRSLIPRSGLLRSIVACATVAVQLAMIASPIWEPRPGVRLGVHAEEQGATRHPGQHSEESCVVCAARAQAQAPASPMPEIAFDSPRFAPLARSQYAIEDVRAVSTQSRAPPSV